MKKILSLINNNLIISILISMFIGLTIGYYFDVEFLKKTVTVLSFFMVYPVMISLDYKKILDKGSIKLQIITQIVNFIYLPLLAYLFGLIFFKTEIDLRLGLLLIALLPTSGMTISWTVMAKGNTNEAIRMVIIGLILGGLLTPLYINVLLKAEVSLKFIEIFKQILLIVFLPMLLGFLTQLLIKKVKSEEYFQTKTKPFMPLIATLSVVILIGVAMSLRAKLIINNPKTILKIIVPIVLGYLLMVFSIHFIGKALFKYEDRIAFVNGTIVRSLSLALAIAVNLFTDNPYIPVIIAIAYIVQAQTSATYTRLAIKSINNTKEIDQKESENVG